MDDPIDRIIDEARIIANDESKQVNIRKLAAFTRELASDLEGSTTRMPPTSSTWSIGPQP
jgi:hypothetical protein